MISTENKLFPEDFSTLVGRTDDGPCAQVSALVSMVLNRCVREVIVDINRELSGVFDFQGDYSHYGYAYRNVFELACWILHGWYQRELFDDFKEDRIHSVISECVTRRIAEDHDVTAKRLLVAWYWYMIDREKIQETPFVANIADADIDGVLVDIVEECVERQMVKSAGWVQVQVEELKAAHMARYEEPAVYCAVEYRNEYVPEKKTVRTPVAPEPKQEKKPVVKKPVEKVIGKPVEKAAGKPVEKAPAASAKPVAVHAPAAARPSPKPAVNHAAKTEPRKTEAEKPVPAPVEEPVVEPAAGPSNEEEVRISVEEPEVAACFDGVSVGGAAESDELVINAD